MKLANSYLAGGEADHYDRGMTPASFRIAREYHTNHLGVQVVEQAAKSCGFTVVEVSDTAIKLRATFNFWSYGEAIDVVLGEIEDRRLIDITSRCVFRMQIVDWGRNERNVHKLFQEIDNLLSPDSDYKQCTICNKCDYLLVGISSESCPECGRPFVIGDESKSQDTATLRNALVLVLFITAAEYCFGVVLDAVGFGRYVPPFIGRYFGLHLLGYNACAIGTVLGLHHLFKRFVRRP